MESQLGKHLAADDGVLSGFGVSKDTIKIEEGRGPTNSCLKASKRSSIPTPLLLGRLCPHRTVNDGFSPAAASVDGIIAYELSLSKYVSSSFNTWSDCLNPRG